MNEQGPDFEPSGHHCGCLRAFISALEDGATKQQAQRLQKLVSDVILDDVKRKYTAATPLAHVAHYEKQALSRCLRPEGQSDPSLHPIHVRLHWEVKLEELEEKVERFRADPSKFTVTDGYVRVLKFYLSGPVPPRLKEKGKQFLYDLQDAGKTGRRQGGGRGGGGGGGGARQGYSRRY